MTTDIEAEARMVASESFFDRVLEVTQGAMGVKITPALEDRCVDLWIDGTVAQRLPRKSAAWKFLVQLSYRLQDAEREIDEWKRCASNHCSDWHAAMYERDALKARVAELEGRETSVRRCMEAEPTPAAFHGDGGWARQAVAKAPKEFG
jgi:hypothetical protein